MTGGLWLTVVSAVYLAVGIFNFAMPFMAIEFIQAVYCLVLALPLFVPPLARAFNIKCLIGEK
jgi:hypothetical protein